MEVINETYVDPREIKEILEKYGDKENPLVLKTLESLSDLMDLDQEKYEKLKEIIPEEVIFKIIEINPKNEEQVKLIVGEKYKEVCEILFGE
jgi:DNA-directed RNA polymerase subunit F